MTLATPAATKTEDVRLWAEEMRREALTAFAIVLMLVGGLGAAATMPDLYYGRGRVLVLLCLFAAGAVAFAFRTRLPNVAKAGLLLGPPLAVAIALRVLDVPGIAFYTVLGVVAGAAVSPYLGFISALVSSVVLVSSLAPGPTVLAAVLLLWITAGVQWVSSRGMTMALQLAWDGQERARKLLEEL
ncbi:MAG: hypothetical protein ACUVX9_03420, partial [Anaerolineae bacterium]